MDIQWFPGHMTKALREMQNNIKLVDLVIELLDSRVPMSSGNPELSKIAQGKQRLILLNKADMADDKITSAWIEYFKEKGIKAVAVDSRSTASKRTVKQAVDIVVKEKKERDLKRGIKGRPVRAMVVGIPNVGKSTFINCYSGRSSAKTGNMPGVTKGTQWIRLSGDLELLDTPGVLWPKFEDQVTGMHLAMTGAVRSEVLDMSDVAVNIISMLKENYPGKLGERYGCNEDNGSVEIFEEIASKRGCLRKGGVIDTDKTALIICDDMKNGRFGKISFESPSDIEQ